MNEGHIPTAFSMLIEEFERAIHETNRQGAQAFVEKNYDLVLSLTGKAQRLENFQSRIGLLEDEWAAAQNNKEEEEKKGKWKKTDPATPVAFHASCLHRASAFLNDEFQKQTRSSYLSKDQDTALVCSISREHDNGSSRFFWFSFHPYQGEFLASRKNGYLLLGCGSPDIVLLIPFCDFSPWSKKLNKSERDDTYYSHIRIISDSGAYRLKLEGRGNQVDLTKYVIPPQ